MNNLVIIGTGSAKFCGSGKIKTRILNELGKKGYEVHYVTEGKPHLSQSRPKTFFKNHIIKSPHSDFLGSDRALDLFTIAQTITDIAIKAINQKKIPILWATYLYPYGLSALLAKDNINFEKQVDIKLIVTPAGSDIWQIGSAQLNNLKTLLFDKRIDARITYCSEFMNEIVTKLNYQDEFMLIPPFVDTNLYKQDEIIRNQFRIKFDIDQNDIVIIHHSNMRQIKDPESVVEVVERAYKKIKNKKVTLLLVGPRPFVNSETHWLNKIKQDEVFKTKSGLNILWTGLIDKVWEILSVSDIAINCSKHDSFNVSLLEAMSCGLPSITTNVVGIKDHIKSSGGGILIPMVKKRLNHYETTNNIPNKKVNLNKMANVLTGLINNQATRAEMGIKATKYVENNLSTDAIVPKIEDILLDLANGVKRN